jgi:hypothetical protein
MKKIALALIALLFLVSVYFGFQAAAHLDGHLKKTAPNNSLEGVSAQQNYLIFQVSELGGESPLLVSVWGLFVHDAAPPHLAFVSLYPPAGTEQEDDSFSFFRLTRDARIPDRVIKKIERKYHIETNGYFLVDNFSASSIETWLGLENASFPSQPPLSPSERQTILSHNQRAISQFCAQISQNGVDQVINQIHWTDLLPEHFLTNVSTELWLQAVNKLASSPKIGSCEVFIGQ